MRTYEQCRRLALEEAILRREMSQVRILNKQSEHGTYAEGPFTAEGSSQEYQLRAPIPWDYPDGMPSLLIVQPHTLRRCGGGTINELGATHNFHTARNGPGGCVGICHSPPENWDASKTLVGVFIKGAVWLAAYQAHLATGRPICDFVLTDHGTPLFLFSGSLQGIEVIRRSNN